MKISVIMLTYNREAFLPQSINAILMQKFEDFEFIIVNNGSTDDSKSLIESYQLKDSRIRVINLPKSSIAEGRQQGILHAKGAYITFVDDDDLICDDMLMTLERLQGKYNADITFCGSYNKIGDTIVHNCSFEEKEVCLTPEEAVKMLLGRKKCSAAMPTKLFKKELFKTVFFQKESVHEDIFVTYKLFANAGVIAASGEPKYYFVKHDTNISGFTMKDSLITPDQLEEYFRAFRERTHYLSSKLPEIKDYVQYCEWSFLISMCNKILVNDLQDCKEQLEKIKKELKLNYDDFYESRFIEEFEKKFMVKYIKHELEDKEN